MSTNPYESTEHQDRPTRIPPFILDRPQGGGRPWGIIALGLWHIVHGLLPACAIVLLFVLGQAPPLHTLGLPIFVAGLTIAIGIGVLRGENWGWRGSAFFSVIQVVQPILDIIRGQQPSGLSLLEAVIGAGAFAYLFSDQVLHYFGMYGIQKLPTAGRIIGICCVLLAIITFSN